MVMNVSVFVQKQQRIIRTTCLNFSNFHFQHTVWSLKMQLILRVLSMDCMTSSNSLDWFPLRFKELQLWWLHHHTTELLKYGIVVTLSIPTWKVKMLGDDEKKMLEKEDALPTSIVEESLPHNCKGNCCRNEQENRKKVVCVLLLYSAHWAQHLLAAGETWVKLTSQKNQPKQESYFFKVSLFDAIHLGWKWNDWLNYAEVYYASASVAVGDILLSNRPPLTDSEQKVKIR